MNHVSIKDMQALAVAHAIFNRTPFTAITNSRGQNIRPVTVGRAIHPADLVRRVYQ